MSGACGTRRGHAAEWTGRAYLGWRRVAWRGDERLGGLAVSACPGVEGASVQWAMVEPYRHRVSRSSSLVVAAARSGLAASLAEETIQVAVAASSGAG